MPEKPSTLYLVGKPPPLPLQPITLTITLYSLKQAEAFIAKGSHAAERIALDLEEAEVRAWFDDPGYCSCEMTFPGDTLEDLSKEVGAARSVGAEVKVAIPRGDL